MTSWLLLLLPCWATVGFVSGQDYNISLESDYLGVPLDVPPPKGQRNLIQLHILFRHGMRAPDQSFPTDPNPDHVWKEGLGLLTQHGKYQHYALGQQLRWMYRDFITPNPTEIEVLSSQKNRCVLSALCNVAALLKPDEKWEFVPGLSWQPFPVLYASPVGKDNYLGKDFDCPKAKREAKKFAKSKEGQKFLKEHKDLINFWMFHSHLKIDTWADAATLHDVLNMHKIYNHQIPEWATQYWDELCYFKEMNFQFAARNTEYQRLRAGPLLGLIFSKMEDKIEGKSKKKVHMYSGHSKNMVAMLSTLDVFNSREPPFCATLILELYQESDGHSVRLLYLNSTTPETGDQEPHLLQLRNCGEYCHYNKFSRMVEDLVPLDWEEECHHK